MASIELDDLCWATDEGRLALDGLSLTVDDGEHMGVVGPSGSGKTSMLRAVAGLVRVDHGTVRLGGRDTAHVPPRRRHLLMAGDAEGLNACMSAVELAVLPQGLRRAPRPLRRRAVPLAAVADNLRGLPAALLLDGPVSRLDPIAQRDALEELARFHRATGVTILRVSNRLAGGLSSCDRVAVMREGQIEQVATLAVLISRPLTSFVATFIGLASMLDVVVDDDAGLGWLRVGEQRLRFPGGLPGPLRERAGQHVHLAVGVGSGRVRVPGDPIDATLSGRVETIARTGPVDHVTVATPGGAVVATRPAGAAGAPGDTVEIFLDVRSTAVFDPVTSTAIWHGER